MTSRRRAAEDHQLFHGEAAAVCQALSDEVRFDLVYLDPPYAVGSAMAARDKKGQARGRKRAESGRTAYHDGGDVDALVRSLSDTLVQVRERMHPHAALYLHMDHRAVHEAKVAADGIFGRRCFCGEVVWAPGNGSRGARGFALTHQTILIYRKSAKKRLRFRCDHPLLREPYADTSLRMHFTHVDDDGRRYRERVIRDKRYRYYADEGRRIGSVWTDIPAMVANTPLMREGTGYPTQKPERLLERIVRASSEPGETVADLMCGSGTSLVVAADLGRRFVGGDRGELAIETTRARLDERSIGYRFDELRLEGVPEDPAKRKAKAKAERIARGDARPRPAKS